MRDIIACVWLAFRAAAVVFLFGFVGLMLGGILVRWLLPILAVAFWASAASAAPPKVPGPIKATPGDVVEVEVEEDAAGKIGFHNPYDVTSLFVRDAVPRRDKTLCLIIQPREKAVYRLTVWTVGENRGATLIVDATGGILPKPPEPKPPEPEPKPPEPKPVPVTSFRVIFVYESGDPLTVAQHSVMYSRTVSDYLSAKTTADGGWAGWRRFDKDASGENETAPIKAMWANAKPRIQSTPAVAVEVNGKTEIYPLPATPIDAVAFFKKLRGE